MKRALRRRWAARLAVACALAAALPAGAHDTWLQALPASRGSAFVLATGNRYPVAEVAPSARSLAATGCVDARGRRARLAPQEASARGLALRSAASGAVACWAELHAFEVTLEPPLVEVYLREIRPPAAVRATWAAQLEQGLPWVERYRKFARIERGTASAEPAVLRRLRAPLGMPLEIVAGGETPLRAGELAAFRVLAHGEPVAGLSVELVSDRSRFGAWARTDAQGRLQHRLPFAGKWVLRAVLLEADGEGGRWNSRFVTFAFEVW